MLFWTYSILHIHSYFSISTRSFNAFKRIESIPHELVRKRAFYIFSILILKNKSGFLRHLCYPCVSVHFLVPISWNSGARRDLLLCLLLGNGSVARRHLGKKISRIFYTVQDVWKKNKGLLRKETQNLPLNEQIFAHKYHLGPKPRTTTQARASSNLLLPSAVLYVPHKFSYRSWMKISSQHFT